jgi:hypothetical protein
MKQTTGGLMAKLKHCAGFALGMTVSLAGHAGALSKALIAGQVQQFLDAGKVTGCGVTLSAIEEGSSPTDVLKVFNGSFMMSSPFAGLMKGRASTITGAKVLSGNIGPGSVKVQKTEVVWVKAQGSEATTISTGQSIRKSEDPGYIMYPTPIKPLLALVDAIQDGAPIQIGMRAFSQKSDAVLFGKVSMSDDDKAALANCITEWVAYVSERYGDQKRGVDASPLP